MATGIVKFFDIMKGYGFIKPSQGGDEVFVHISSLQGTDMSFLNGNQEAETA
jgi:cold shock protein